MTTTFDSTRDGVNTEMEAAGRVLAEDGWLAHYTIGPGPMGSHWVFYVKNNESLILRSYIDVDDLARPIKWQALVTSVDVTLKLAQGDPP